MGQKEIYDYLKENNNKWFTTEHIANKFNISKTAVGQNLKKLVKKKFLEINTPKNEKGGAAAYFYKYKN